MLDPLVLRVFYCNEEKELEFRRVLCLLLGVDFSVVRTLGHVSGAFNPTFRVVEPG